MLWSTVASAFKFSLRYMGPINLLFYSSLTSLIVFGLLHSSEFSPRKENLRFAYLGFLIVLYYLLLFSAYEGLLMLVLLSVPLLGKRPGVKILFGLFIGFLGALIVVTRGNLTNLNFSDLVGVALGLGSAVVWATYWLLNLRDKRSLIEKTFWNFLFGFAYVSVLLAFAGGFSIPPVEGLIGAVYVGLFEMGVTFLIWYKAVEDDVAFASNLAYFIPFLSLVFIFLVVGEDIMPGTLTGLVLIVLGILIGRKV